MNTQDFRLSHEGLMDIQRAIIEANKQHLHQQVEEQQHLINALNRTHSTSLIGEIKNKLEESNAALRILATQTNKLLDAINKQTEVMQKLLDQKITQNSTDKKAN